jgi:hypothetical protein
LKISNEKAQERTPAPDGADGIPNGEQPLNVGPAKNKAGKIIPGREYEFKNGKTIREHFGHDYPDDPTQNRGNHFNDVNGNHYDYKE